ncbi:MAG: bifunctional serine/threonine protein kinase/MFS transporter [Holophagales bacterium]|nr:bifunctional serine/threonine protein kinase/MFS transporter [Holophagales bacterium]
MKDIDDRSTAPEDDAERWRERHLNAKRIFLEAVRRPAAERHDFVARACEGDADLFDQVVRLLENVGADTARLAPHAHRVSREALARATEPSFAVGATVAGRYRIEGLLGRGGMGQVFLAFDQLLDQRVALKFLGSDVPLRADAVDALLHEARAARAVVAPHVCRVFDAGLDGDEPFLAMEHVDGQDLATTLRDRGCFDAATTRGLALELSQALTAIHAEGLLHRDLKPANILLDRSGRARVTDFGIAIRREAQQPRGQRAGTPGYLAPELVEGGIATVQSDLYGFGMVLLEALIGPLSAAPTLARLSAGLGSASPFAPGGVAELPFLRQLEADPVLEQVIIRCLAPDPEDRPESAETIARALAADDPLEGVVILGERPSSRILALSRARGVLTARQATWLALLAVGTMICHLVAWPQILSMKDAGLGTAPEELAARARQLIDELLPPRARVVEAWGFDQDTDPVVAGWPYPPGLEDGSRRVFFWYRQSSTRRNTWNALEIGANGGRTTRFEPPPTSWDTTLVGFDSRGRLFHFQDTPLGEKSWVPEDAVDWTPLARAAAIDLALFEQLPVQMPWPAAAVRRQAWRGEQAGRETWVEVGHLGSRPTLFLPFQIASEEDGDPAAYGRRSMAFAYLYVGVPLLYLILLLPAWRNLRRGRGDPWGAFRLAVATLVISYASFLLQADHPADATDRAVFAILGLSGPLIKAIGSALLYLGIAPQLQRFWPRSLVSWGRALGGRIRNPAVASHGLIGVAAGTFFALLETSSRALGAAVEDRPLPLPADLPESLPAVRHGVATLLDAPIEGSFLALIFLATLGICRWLVRRPELAIGLAVALFSLGDVLFSPAPWAVATTQALLQFGLAAWIATRIGVLPLAAAMTVLELMQSFPMTLDPAVWYADLTLIALAPWLGLLLACLMGSRRPLARMIREPRRERP